MDYLNDKTHKGERAEQTEKQVKYITRNEKRNKKTNINRLGEEEETYPHAPKQNPNPAGK